MNSHCGICDVEKECGYQYKPCDCCNYRKFVPKIAPVSDLTMALAKRAVEAQRTDTRTEAEIIRDGVAFVMGPKGVSNG